VACGLCKLACPVKAMSGMSIEVDPEEMPGENVVPQLDL